MKGSQVDSYLKVINIFEEQVVYDPRNQKTVGIFKNPQSPFAGKIFSSSESRAIAEGHINPKTMEPFPGDDCEEDSPSTSGKESLYFVPTSKSANQQFKPHFGRPLPPIKPKKVKTCQIPDPRLTVPLFTPPSLRLPH